jgi:hypothetical protein
MTNLMEVLYRNPAQFVSYLQQYNVALAVVIPNSIEARELERSPDWQKIYSESVSDLFQKRSPAPSSGSVMKLGAPPGSSAL